MPLWPLETKMTLFMMLGRKEKPCWKKIMNEFNCMPRNNNGWIYYSSIDKYNGHNFRQTSYSWVKGKANISSIKPQMPKTTISSAFSVLIHS